mmetsp:Transcript_27357/g.63521  ORF Transcript_27357/g.63521 Transcript_27357/m.63521 type:complete len:137 (+) Transcript_27357:285-695(+)
MQQQKEEKGHDNPNLGLTSRSRWPEIITKKSCLSKKERHRPCSFSHASRYYTRYRERPILVELVSAVSSGWEPRKVNVSLPSPCNVWHMPFTERPLSDASFASTTFTQNDRKDRNSSAHSNGREDRQRLLTTTGKL